MEGNSQPQKWASRLHERDGKGSGAGATMDVTKHALARSERDTLERREDYERAWTTDMIMGSESCPNVEEACELEFTRRLCGHEISTNITGISDLQRSVEEVLSSVYLRGVRVVLRRGVGASCVQDGTTPSLESLKVFQGWSWTQLQAEGKDAE